MKKFGCILFVTLLMAVSLVPAWAEELPPSTETTPETALSVDSVDTSPMGGGFETTAETVWVEETQGEVLTEVETTVETLPAVETVETVPLEAGLETEDATSDVETSDNTTAETTAETMSEDMAGIISTATPEQIEQIKQYILYGVGELSKYEGTDGLTAFVLDHLNEIAWLVAGICFVVFAVIFKTKSKRMTDCTAIVNDNACEMVEKSERRIKEANQASEERVEAMMSEASALHELALRELTLVKRRESACAEALTLMATEINSLLQLANLPEWKRDELQTTFNTALAKVEEVSTHEEDEN